MGQTEKAEVTVVAGGLTTRVSLIIMKFNTWLFLDSTLLVNLSVGKTSISCLSTN